jgi:adenosyl cobinamide kinase/adenosyl cobinamide phosphate guanylyltransferase
MPPKIINIIGPAGSGKTYLLEILKKKLGNKIICIDTDEIDDRNALDYLKSHEIDEKNIDTYFNKLKKDNQKDIQDIISKSNKPIIIAGLSINVSKYVDIGYCIRIHPENHYRQLMLRTLEDVVQNYEGLKKLFKSSHTSDTIYEFCVKKYKLRTGFPIPPHEVEHELQHYYDKAKKMSYKIMPFDQIYAEILEIIA